MPWIWTGSTHWCKARVPLFRRPWLALWSQGRSIWWEGKEGAARFDKQAAPSLPSSLTTAAARIRPRRAAQELAGRAAEERRAAQEAARREADARRAAEEQARRAVEENQADKK